MKLSEGVGWTPSGRMLLFEFQNRLDTLKLKLIIGPGPERTRQKLLNLALGDRTLFQPAFRQLNQKWNEIYSRSIVLRESYSGASDEELRGQARTGWQKFLESEFPRLDQAILNAPELRTE